MNKENGIKRLNRLSVKAKEYRDENTQVVKLSQAIEVIELIDQLDEPEDYFEMAFERGNKLIELGQKIKEMQTERQEMKQEINRLKNNQLDEPEKPVVPQFVADWIEKEKRANSQLHSVISTSLNYSNHVENWIDWCKNNKKFTETIARAWLNGYEVVKEPKWVVKLGNSYLYEPMADVGSNGLIRLTRNKIEAYHFESKEMAGIHIDKFGGEAEEVQE